MKKSFIYLFMLTLSLVALSGCGSDDPKSDSQAVANYSLTLSGDVFDVCQGIEITWMGANNTQQTTLLTSGTSWSQMVTSSRFDAKFGYKIRPIAKSEADLTKEAYTLKVSARMVVAVSGKSSSSRTFDETLLDITNVNKSKTIEVVNRANGRGIAAVAEEDGSIDETSPDRIF